MFFLSGQGWNDTVPGGGDRHESTWPFPQCEFKVCTADDIFVFDTNPNPTYIKEGACAIIFHSTTNQKWLPSHSYSELLFLLPLDTCYKYDVRESTPLYLCI